MAETDGRSPINPASLAIRPVPQLFAQYDPELRSVTAGGKTSSTTTARFPNVGATLPLSNRLVLGVNVSTFLDQSWANSRLNTSDAGEDIELTESFKSEGAIEDIRGAIAYALSPSVRLGLGLHGYAARRDSRRATSSPTACASRICRRRPTSAIRATPSQPASSPICCRRSRSRASGRKGGQREDVCR